MFAGLNTALVFLGNAPPAGAQNMAPEFPGQQGPEQGAAYRVGQIVGATVGFPWALSVVLGGISMVRLRNRGTAMAGSIVAMAPCSVCCLLGLPVGIWSVIVLGRSEVIRAFQ